MKRRKLAEELIAVVEGERETDGHVWDQNRWGRVTSCGTIGCVAGHAARLTGWLPVGSSWDMVDLGERREYADVAAAEELQLSHSEAEWLFDGDRTKPEVLKSLKRIRNGKNALSKSLR